MRRRPIRARLNRGVVLGAAVLLLAGCGRIRLDPVNRGLDSGLDGRFNSDSQLEAFDTVAERPPETSLDSSAESGSRDALTAMLDAEDSQAIDVPSTSEAFADVGVDAGSTAMDARADASETGAAADADFPFDALDAEGDATTGDAAPDSADTPSPGPDASSAYPLITSSGGVIRIESMSLRNGGLVLVVGSFTGTLEVDGASTPSAGGQDGFIVGFIPDGSVDFVRTIGGAGLDTIDAVATDVIGNVVFISGSFSGTVDLGDGPRVSSGTSDAFVASFVLGGGTRFVRTFGGAEPDSPFPPDDRAGGLSVDATGAVFVGGQFRGSADFGGGPIWASTTTAFMLCLESNGAFRWVRTVGYTAFNSTLGVATSAGRAYFAGFYEGTPDMGDGAWQYRGVQDTFVAALNSATGTTIWTRNWGSAGFDWPLHLTTLSDGTVVVGGFVEASVDVGTGPLSHAGGRDGLVVALAPNGSTTWAGTVGSPQCDLIAGIASGRFDRVVATGTFGSQPFVQTSAGSLMMAPSARSPQALGFVFNPGGTVRSILALPGELAVVAVDATRMAYASVSRPGGSCGLPEGDSISVDAQFVP